MMLLCGIAMISTSCNKDPQPVNPETASGSMTVGNKTINITTADAVNYGQKNAIVLASKPMTAAENEGVAAFETGYGFAFRSQFDQQSGDVFLLHHMVAGSFAHVDVAQDIA